jgi:hypothetical protein
MDGSVVYNAAGSRKRSHSHDHIFSRLLQPGGPGLRIYIAQELCGPGYTRRQWVPFSSPPTSRRATVEVFDPASTQDPTSSHQLSCLYLGTDRTENIVPLLYRTVAMETRLFAKPLLSKSCSIFAYLAVDAQQRVFMPQYYMCVTGAWIKLSNIFLF